MILRKWQAEILNRYMEICNVHKKFILKAPEQIVSQFKNQEQEVKYSIEKIEQIINTIN